MEFKRFFILLVIIIFTFSILISFLFVPTGERKEVKCYDKYGREILGQVCIEEPITLTNKFAIGCFLGMILFIVIGMPILIKWGEI